MSLSLPLQPANSELRSISISSVDGRASFGPTVALEISSFLSALISLHSSLHSFFSSTSFAAAIIELKFRPKILKTPFAKET